jgi:hypothetical protein
MGRENWPSARVESGFNVKDGFVSACRAEAVQRQSRGLRLKPIPMPPKGNRPVPEVIFANWRERPPGVAPMTSERRTARARRVQRNPRVNCLVHLASSSLSNLRRALKGLNGDTGE